jgi:hypothetical protein
MCIDELLEDVRKRALVDECAWSDVERAIDVARSINDPWYRCQSLAYAAESHPKRGAALALLDEAFGAAQQQADINRIVKVAAWPLRVLAKVDPDRAEARLAELLETAAREPHNLRRGDALIFVAHAVADVPALKERAIPPLIGALLAGYGWRIERLIADAAMLIREDCPQHLTALLAAHPENRRKRQLLRALKQAGTEL